MYETTQEMSPRETVLMFHLAHGVIEKSEYIGCSLTYIGKLKGPRKPIIRKKTTLNPDGSRDFVAELVLPDALDRYELAAMLTGFDPHSLRRTWQLASIFHIEPITGHARFYTPDAICTPGLCNKLIEKGHACNQTRLYLPELASPSECIAHALNPHPRAIFEPSSLPGRHNSLPTFKKIISMPKKTQLNI